jgi:hypothetical protein
MRRIWVITFLALTAGALGMELWASFDGNPDTTPWTELISTYIPQPITVTVLTVLASWLPAHFAHHYTTTKGGPSMGKYKKTIVAVLAAGAVALTSALSDDKVTNAEWVAIGLAALGALGVYAVPNKKDPAIRNTPPL